MTTRVRVFEVVTFLDATSTKDANFLQEVDSKSIRSRFEVGSKSIHLMKSDEIRGEIDLSHLNHDDASESQSEVDNHK
jgi:hypothetical protein